MSGAEDLYEHPCPVCGRRMRHDTVGGPAPGGDPQELICPPEGGCGSQWRLHPDGRPEILMRTVGAGRSTSPED